MKLAHRGLKHLQVVSTGDTAFDSRFVVTRLGISMCDISGVRIEITKGGRCRLPKEVEKEIRANLKEVM